jgi:hypothetical protein
MFMVLISIDRHTLEISVGLYYELPNNDVYNQIRASAFPPVLRIHARTRNTGPLRRRKRTRKRRRRGSNVAIRASRTEPDGVVRYFHIHRERAREQERERE